MVSLWLYTGLLAATGLERLAELVVSKRNAAWAFERGGVEYGRAHYGFMVVLHSAFLMGCLVEPWLMERPFVPWLGWPMLAIAVGAQALRWWVIRTLGPRWNTRVIVVPGMPLVEGGPFRYVRHPNYVAVVLEGIALPLVHSAWLTASVFTVLNAVLLSVRVRVENEALGRAPGAPQWHSAPGAEACSSPGNRNLGNERLADGVPHDE
jgi:methyltransferase